MKVSQFFIFCQNEIKLRWWIIWFVRNIMSKDESLKTLFSILQHISRKVSISDRAFLEVLRATQNLSMTPFQTDTGMTDLYHDDFLEFCDSPGSFWVHDVAKKSTENHILTDQLVYETPLQLILGYPKNTLKSECIQEDSKPSRNAKKLSEKRLTFFNRFKRRS